MASVFSLLHVDCYITYAVFSGANGPNIKPAKLRKREWFMRPYLLIEVSKTLLILKEVQTMTTVKKIMTKMTQTM